ncbi:MAG TPA: ATP-binding protein [Salinivirga sp.]|uniref:sensor histidine kinase n=1 Tax=Salinivirga sp. TaxID=1970192 RepID=UPI002B47121C|nr:ATP-binding protein [Salinivirga sp.]HKK59214.1 ATP-binding protein [Salinivirga sp.]
MSNDIDHLRKNILDISLIITACLGAVAYLISLTRLMNNDLSVTYFLEFMVMLSLGTVAIFRKKLSTIFKASVFLLLVFFFSMYDAFFYGVFSAARIYIVLIPFFSFLYFSFSRVIIFHSIVLIGFIAIGYMHYSGIQSLPKEYHPNDYVLKFYPWIINAIHITIVAFIILLIMRKMLGRYENLLHELKQYKDHLERLVSKRTEELETTNEELKSANEELFEQREELQDTLESLKGAQNQLVQSEKMASLGILTAGVAHEINNPVNFIYSGTNAVEDYIKERFPDHMPHLNPYFDAINTGVDRTVNIVKSLGRYTRSEELPWNNFDLHEVLDDCLTMLYNKYKNRIKIHRKYSEQDLTILGNEGQIHQVFLNILVNAIDACFNEGNINIHTRKTTGEIEIRIKDDGEGIKPGDLKHIFDPFFTTKDPGKGTGLGLSISQKIVNDHGGNIECESQLQNGTAFLIRLPLDHKAE